MAVMVVTLFGEYRGKIAVAARSKPGNHLTDIHVIWMIKVCRRHFYVKQKNSSSFINCDTSRRHFVGWNKKIIGQNSQSRSKNLKGASAGFWWQIRDARP